MCMGCAGPEWRDEPQLGPGEFIYFALAPPDLKARHFD